jgi:hypothetical protein
MGTVVMCVLLCLLAGTSAMAGWSFCQFWQRSRRAARCRALRTRRGGYVQLAPRESERHTTSKLADSRAGDAALHERGQAAQRRDASCDQLPATDQSMARGRPAKAMDTKACAPATAPVPSTDAVPAAPPRHRLPRSSSVAHGRPAKAGAPAPSTDAVPAAPPRHRLPRSSSVAHGRPAKARDTKACAPATAPVQSTDAVLTAPPRHRLPGSSSF